jgi:hypothetical protein
MDFKIISRDIEDSLLKILSIFIGVDLLGNVVVVAKTIRDYRI